MAAAPETTQPRWMAGLSGGGIRCAEGQITGALAELFRRVGMELGAIAPPPGTRRVDRTFSVALRASSINTVALRSRSFDRLKVDVQGLLMREMHRMHYLLPRPIPSADADGIYDRASGRFAPVWVHARLRFPKRATRDAENFRTFVSKALGDALTGPFWKGTGSNHRPAHRRLSFRGRVYEGGWLVNDTDRDWILTFDFDEQRGPACLTVWLVWDQAA